MGFKRFEDILAWKQARTLVTEVYSITVSHEALRADSKFSERLQDSAVRIMSGIAGGFATNNVTKFSQQLEDSLRAASELQSLLYVCADLEYIDRRYFERLSQMTQICTRMLQELYTLINKKIARTTQYQYRPPVPRPAPPPPPPQQPPARQEPHIMEQDMPTRKSKPYKPKPVMNDEEEEIEKPDIAPIYDHEDLINPPKWDNLYK